MSAEQLVLGGPADTPPEVERWASISGDGVYRYLLGRQWDDTGPLLGWVMLNPSTADATLDDPTIRRCVGFAKSNGYSGILVGNLYAYRATDPREVRRALAEGVHAVGPENPRYLRELGCTCPVVVCAWGANAEPRYGRAVTARLVETGTGVVCLGRTKAGHPRHPLYVRADQVLETYR